MLKIEIKLDHGQLLSEGKYNPKDIYAEIDKYFVHYHLERAVLSDGTICYSGTGNPRDYGAFGKIITTLRKKEWFMTYLIKWLWYNSDGGEDEEDYIIEDILYHYTSRASKK